MNPSASILVLSPESHSAAAAALAEGLERSRSRTLEPPSGTGAMRVAAALVAAEREIAEEAPAAVVLCGSGPEAGAAVLAAAKLGVPSARVGADGDRAADDPAVLADLGGAIADALADLTISGDDPDAAVDEIRAWAETYTLSP
jgi:hypothetical protein